MDIGGNIDEKIPDFRSQEVTEYRKRFDDFIRGSAKAGRKKHERLIWNSQTQGTYRKPKAEENDVGIEGIEELAPDPAEEHRVEIPDPIPEPEPTEPDLTQPTDGAED